MAFTQLEKRFGFAAMEPVLIRLVRWLARRLAVDRPPCDFPTLDGDCSRGGRRRPPLVVETSL